MAHLILKCAWVILNLFRLMESIIAWSYNVELNQIQSKYVNSNKHIGSLTNQKILGLMGLSLCWMKMFRELRNSIQLMKGSHIKVNKMKKSKLKIIEFKNFYWFFFNLINFIFSFLNENDHLLTLETLSLKPFLTILITRIIINDHYIIKVQFNDFHHGFSHFQHHHLHQGPQVQTQGRQGEIGLSQKGLLNQSTPSNSRKAFPQRI